MAIKVNQEAAASSKTAMNTALQSFLESMKKLDKVVDDFSRTQEGNWVTVLQGKYANEFKPAIQKGITENVEIYATMFTDTVQKWMDIDAGVS
jgi:hypothetical protein